MKAGVHAPTYRSWQMMKDRCLNPKGQDYKYYGARGITVTDAWSEYEGFLAAMGERPRGMTLDRRDGELGYDVTNCRWATRLTQARNREYTINLTFSGRTQRVWEWAEELGVKQTTIHIRLWRFKRGDITEAQVFNPNPRKSKA